MKFEDFLSLSNIEEILDAILTGCNIASRDSGANKIFLVAIDDFYVEIYYDLEAKEFIKCIAFNDITMLDPYLEEIDISSITEMIETPEANFTFQPVQQKLIEVVKKVNLYIRNTFRPLS